VADLLDRVLGEIRERMERAQAAVEESRRLEAALAALERERSESSPRPRRGRRGAGAGRRAPRGANRDAIVGVVSERPGVSAAEIAGATGIARATVGSTLSRLVADGVLELVELPAGGRGYRLAQTAPQTGAEAEDHPEPASAPSGPSEG
jgi:CRP-like cAMP-binding protein